MNLKNFKYLFLLMMAVFMLSSCSEDDNTVDEYANWQERNEQAFADTLAYAKAQIAAGSTQWKVIRKWSLNNQTSNTITNQDGSTTTTPLTYKDYDNIVVQVLEEGKGSGCPMYTDSVKVSYRGRLLGTDTYPAGYVFDKTFEGTYNKATAQLSKFVVSGLVDGFTTALLNMHIGDHWLVYIPYQLGYGTTESSSSSIPAYSMLRFEIVLDSYYRVGQTVPSSRAAQKAENQKGTWITE